jgi:MscS family membrane protein
VQLRREPCDIRSRSVVSGVGTASRVVCALVLCLGVGLGSPTLAVPATPDTFPLEPPDTSSPRATLQSFVGNMKAASDAFITLMTIYRQEPGLYFSAQAKVHQSQMRSFLHRAVQCLDLTEVSPTLSLRVSQESTLLLKEILDRVDLPDPASVPDAEAMSAASLDRWRIPRTGIVIAKATKGERAGEFLFTPATLQRLPEFYEKVRDRPYRPGSWEGAYAFFTTIGVPEYVPWKVTDALPLWAKAPVWEQALWRWIVFGLALVALLGALTAVRRGINRLGAVDPIRQDVRRLVLPVAVSLAAWSLGFVSDAINITGQARVIIATILGAILVVAVAWSVLVIGDLVAEIIVASPRFKMRSLDEAIVRLASRILALAFAILVTVYGAQLLGLPVVPLLAGLGVGGLALALAAQPTIENLIAALTLHADRPARVGDFCRFGDTVGIVEEIGMRSTRIRTLDHTVLSVPNADFAKGRVENYSARRKIWYHPRIRLRYETTAGPGPLHPGPGGQALVRAPPSPAGPRPNPLRRVRRVFPGSRRVRIHRYERLRRLPGDRRGPESANHGRHQGRGDRIGDSSTPGVSNGQGPPRRGECPASRSQRRGMARPASIVPSEIPPRYDRQAARIARLPASRIARDDRRGPGA